jgi:alpha-tubulin suppressor-like RCC1 family protein
VGNGTSGNQQLTPVRVLGGLHFRTVSAGVFHSCGLTSDDKAYCWGSNVTGQLGDGTTTERHRPVPVAGGLSFRQVSAGDFHSCGVTTTHQAYCWGANGGGQLGNGTTTTSLTPKPVGGPI